MGDRLYSTSDNLPACLVRLELDSGADERAIKRAYARELKLIDQEREGTRFQALRDAYQAALLWAARAPASVAAATTAPPRTAPEQQQAQCAFDDFMAARALISTGRMVGDAALWQDELQRRLNDPGLINMEARTLFEERVVLLLAEGWQRGHDTLLAAACDVFDWSADRRRLQQFGYAGALVDRAIDERTMFALQPERIQATQKKVLARLRKKRAPDSEQLQRDMFYLDQLLIRFPTWMAVTVDRAKVRLWKDLFRQMQAVRFEPFHVDEAPAPAPAAPPQRWPHWSRVRAALDFVRSRLA